MELYAVEYATEKGYDFPKYPPLNGTARDNVIPMKDLFDMMAGTSTGSIISAALSFPSNDVLPSGEQVPLYWSKEVIDVYSKQGDQIFQKKQGSGNFVRGLIFFVFITIIGGLFYILGKIFYDNDAVK